MEGNQWHRYGRTSSRPWYETPGEGAVPSRPVLDTLERFVLALALAGLTALVLTQALLLVPQVRRILVQVEGMEGTLFPGPPAGAGAGGGPGTAAAAGAGPGAPVDRGADGRDPPDDPGGPGRPAHPDDPGRAVPALGAPPVRRLTVALVSQPSAPHARLLVDGRPVADFRTDRVTLYVSPGQELAVDTTRHPQPLTFRIIEAVGFSAPALGTEWTARGEVTSLGPVRGR